MNPCWRRSSCPSGTTVVCLFMSHIPGLPDSVSICSISLREVESGSLGIQFNCRIRATLSSLLCSLLHVLGNQALQTTPRTFLARWRVQMFACACVLPHNSWNSWVSRCNKIKRNNNSVRNVLSALPTSDAVMENNDKTSLSALRNSRAVAGFNKCTLLAISCDKWHKSEGFVREGTESTADGDCWLVPRCLNLPGTCLYLLTSVLSGSLIRNTHLQWQVHENCSLFISPPLPLFLCHSCCPDGGSNSAHAGWEKWHPDPNSEKFSNQDPQRFFR